MTPEQYQAILDNQSWVFNSTLILITLVVLQLLAKVAILSWAISVLQRVERLLRVIEMNAELTDHGRDRLAAQITQQMAVAKQETTSVAKVAALTSKRTAEKIDDVRAAVDRVPDVTVEKLKGNDSLGDSGRLPVVPPQ